MDQQQQPWTEQEQLTLIEIRRIMNNVNIFQKNIYILINK
jgi:hypothetical protein